MTRKKYEAKTSSSEHHQNVEQKEEKENSNVFLLETRDMTEDDTQLSTNNNTTEIIPGTQEIPESDLESVAATNTSKNWNTTQQPQGRKRTTRK